METFQAELIILLAVSTSIITYLSVSLIRKILKKYKIVSTDLHKQNKPKIPNCGGIALAIGFSLFLISIFVITKEVQILYILTISLLFGLLGFIDDLMELGKYEKLFCTVLISIFAALSLGLSGISLFLGILFFIAISNIFNIFAGLNGLEIGSSTIISFFFMFFLFIFGHYFSSSIMLGIFLILLSFLFYNKYPARIFPGNIGTLLIGGFFASFTLYYSLYFFLIPLLSLHIIDCLLKGFSAGYFSFSEKKPTKVLKNGILKPEKDFLSFIRLLLRIKPMDEKQTVRTIWFFEVLVGVLTLGVMI